MKKREINEQVDDGEKTNLNLTTMACVKQSVWIVQCCNKMYVEKKIWDLMRVFHS